jgi:uncharacterized membrane-anchored protein YitT (DUF2179 family)
MVSIHTRSFMRRLDRRVFVHTALGNVTGRTFFEIVMILAGAVLMAVSVDVFLNPNNVVPGGFTALAMFANRLWGWPIGVTLLALNLPFLIVGMRLLGAQFGPKTIFAAAASALAIDFLKPYLPVVQGEPMLYTLYGGLLYGLGLGLVFRANATSGGTEIPAKLLEHFYGTRMSTSLLAMDAVILLLAARFFGLAPALYALIMAWVTNRVIDFLETGVSAATTAFIVTGNPATVRRQILDDLERGVTVLRAEGGYTGEERLMLYTVVNNREVPHLRRIVSEADPEAFMVVSPSHEVLGEGFKPLIRGRRTVSEPISQLKIDQNS